MAKHPSARSRLGETLRGIRALLPEVELVQRADAWINAITGLGGVRDKTTRAEIADFVALSPAQLEALYHAHDLAAKIVDAPIEDGFRGGFEIAGDDGRIADALRKWRVLPAVREGKTWGRLYGAGAILVGHKGADMREPLQPDAPGELQYLLVLDRQNLSIASYEDAPESPDYGRPRTYKITRDRDVGQYRAPARRPGEYGSGVGAGAGLSPAPDEIHASRLIKFGGALTAERIRIKKNDGFDLSVLQRPHEVLRDADQTWRSIQHLLQDLSQSVFAMHGLIDMIAQGEKDTVMDRMAVVDMARSVARAVVIDAEHERFEHTGAVNVTGIEPSMMLTFHRLAGAASMPLTRLIGMSPGGMNATGESDTRAWYDVVDDVRRQDSDEIARLIEIVARAEGIAVEGTPEILWPSLWQSTPDEEAARERLRADTYRQWIDSGTLMPEEVTLALFQDDPDFADVIDFGLREQTLKEPEPVPEPPPAPGAPPAPPAPPGAPEPPPEV